MAAACNVCRRTPQPGEQHAVPIPNAKGAVACFHPDGRYLETQDAVEVTFDPKAEHSALWRSQTEEVERTRREMIAATYAQMRPEKC